MQSGKNLISPVVISTALGHDGQGIFPYTLLPGYRRLLKRSCNRHRGVHQNRHPLAVPGQLHPRQPLHLETYPAPPGDGHAQCLCLTNKGWRPAPRISGGPATRGLRVIPNIYPEFIKGTDMAIRETLEAVAIYRRSLGPHFKALELNYSCPNSEEAIAKNVVQAIQCTRKVAASIPTCFNRQTQHLPPLRVRPGTGVHRGHALHAVNTIPYGIVFPLQRSPLDGVGGGGVSGGPACELAYKYNQELRPRVGLFLIMGCGVRGKDEVQRHFDLGADAVSLCTLALRCPGRPPGLWLLIMAKGSDVQIFVDCKKRVS